MTPMRIKTIAILGTKAGKDLRFRRTLRFLAAKGYVQTALPPSTSYRQKISAKDLLWSCENVEPRLYQLIPAVLLRFEGHFESISDWPPEIRHMTEALKKNMNEPIIWQGLPDSVLKGWILFPTRDRRSRKAGSKRMSLRLETHAAQFLDSYCAERRIDRTEAIHRAIEMLNEK